MRRGGGSGSMPPITGDAGGRPARSAGGQGAGGMNTKMVIKNKLLQGLSFIEESFPMGEGPSIFYPQRI